MANRYYVNKNRQDNGDHEVHTTGCSWMPLDHNRIFVGNYDSCGPAVRAAKQFYPQSNGCAYCCPRCHTS